MKLIRPAPVFSPRFHGSTARRFDSQRSTRHGSHQSISPNVNESWQELALFSLSALSTLLFRPPLLPLAEGVRVIQSREVIVIYVISDGSQIAGCHPS